MKKALLLSVLAMSASLASAQAPTRMEMPKMQQSYVKADFALTSVKTNQQLAVPVKKLSSTQITKGKTIETYMMSDGMIAKRLVSDSYALPKKAKTIGKAYATAAAALEEGFEGYDGTAYDWIPANWQDVSKATPAHVAPGEGTKKMNLTWETVGAKLTEPNSGNYMARVQVSIADVEAGIPEEAQDEWLITPAVNVPAGSYLNFYLSYSPAFTRLNMVTFDFTGKNNILEVMISADNGATWNKLWDVMEDAMKYTDEELWNDASTMSHPYIPVLINLKDYVGKSVQVAFRYVGKSGESMQLDDIVIGAVTPIAKYEEPVNLMKVGLSNAWGGLNNVALYPAYQNVTWYNTSKLANAYSWEYADPNSTFDFNTGTSSATAFAETKDLVAPKYPMGLYAGPTLTASLDASSADYKSELLVMQAGGNLDEYNQQTGAATLWGVGLYDITTLLKNTQTKDAIISSTDVFGFGTAFSNVWNSIIVNNQLGQSASCTGLGAVVPKPEVPYMLSYIYAFVHDKDDLGNVSFDPASKLKIAIHPLNAEGNILPDILATGTCTGADITANNGTAIFFLERKDGELVETVDLTITTGLFIEMTMESANAKDDISLITILANDGLDIKDYETYAILNIDGNTKYFPSGQLGFGSSNSSVTKRAKGYALHLGVTYNWLFERNGRNTYDSIGPDGGSCTFNMNSLYNMEQMADVSGEGMYDWWDVSYGAFDINTANQDMTFTFQPLPAGVDSRDCVARVSTPGVAEVQYYISQRRHGGVESVVTSTSSAQVIDGNFVVSSNTADAVMVYNVAGQLVASAAVEGSAVIPAANLANGLYIVKFNDNTVIKVMK